MKLIDKPQYATWEEWEAWRKESQEKYPIKYFLQETLPLELSYIKSRIRDFYWAIIYRTCPRHQYQLVDTKLKPGYYDLDTRLEHCAFSLLEDFVERQDWKDQMNFIHELKATKEKYDSLPEGEEKAELRYQLPGINQVEHYIEADTIYKWWKQFKNRKNIYDIYPCPAKEIFNIQDHEKAAITEWGKNIDAAEYKEKVELEEMLVRLIKIRTSLWN